MHELTLTMFNTFQCISNFNIFITWMWQEEELRRKAQKEAEAERSERAERQKQDEQSNLEKHYWRCVA